jgi:hypothetical protein
MIRVNRYILKSWIAILSVTFLLFGNCISSPMPGLIVTRTKQHLTSGTTGGIKLQSVSIVKSGKSCSVGSWLYVAYFYFGGGGSIQEAMQEGGLQRIATIDRESFSVLAGLYYQECTVVWGD